MPGTGGRSSSLDTAGVQRCARTCSGRLVSCRCPWSPAMIAGVEIGLLLCGLLALASGKLMVSGTTMVRGAAARLLGLVLMAPLPLSFLLGLLFGLALWKLEIQLPEDQLRRYCLFIEAET